MCKEKLDINKFNSLSKEEKAIWTGAALSCLLTYMMCRDTDDLFSKALYEVEASHPEFIPLILNWISAIKNEVESAIQSKESEA